MVKPNVPTNFTVSVIEIVYKSNWEGTESYLRGRKVYRTAKKCINSCKRSLIRQPLNLTKSWDQTWNIQGFRGWNSFLKNLMYLLKIAKQSLQEEFAVMKKPCISCIICDHLCRITTLTGRKLPEPKYISISLRLLWWFWLKNLTEIQF